MLRKQSNVEPGNGLTSWQWNTLATICLVLLVELAVAIQWLFRLLTGQSWSIASLAIAFVTVSLLHEPMERWIWRAEPSGKTPGTPRSCEELEIQ